MSNGIYINWKLVNQKITSAMLSVQMYMGEF